MRGLAGSAGCHHRGRAAPGAGHRPAEVKLDGQLLGKLGEAAHELAAGDLFPLALAQEELGVDDVEGGLPRPPQVGVRGQVMFAGTRSPSSQRWR